jgi:hypothetical protein
MPATPKTLVAAPGTGKMILPLNIFNILKVGTPVIPYQDLGALTPQIFINLGSTGIASDSAILGAVADQTTFYSLYPLVAAGTLDNQPLTLTTITQPVVGSSILYSYISYTVVNL